MSMTVWASEALGEVADMLCDKISVTKLTVENYISTENMLPDRGGVEIAAKLPTAGNVNMFAPGDVLFSNIRTYFKKVWLADRHGGASADVIVFRARDSQRVNCRYLYYVLSSDSFIESTVTASKGTKMPRGDKDAMRNYGITLPPIAVQQHISGILTAYDELIENNQRRIRILEEMARILYREWFVHFRYPGHESVPLVESPLGQIPQGWEVTTLRAVTTKIGSGATPRGGKDAYKSEGIHLIRSMNIYDYEFEFDGLAFIDEQQAAELDNVTVEENDILLNITGASVARCALVPSYLLPARVNQHVAIVRADPAKASPFYILDAINSDQRKQQLLTLAQGGATREALTKDTVSNFEIVLPPRSLMKRYDNIARGIHMKREVLQRQSQNLRRTRDLLLPRLLSGQVSLSDVAMEATQ